MSDHDEELRNEELMRYALKWIEISDGIEKADTGPLYHYLRSGNSISKDVRKLLADLFDPNKPMGIYAEIVLERGNNSKVLRDIELYHAVEEWKGADKKKGMPDVEWAKIAKIFKSGGIAGARAAHRRGRLALEMYYEINALED